MKINYSIWLTAFNLEDTNERIVYWVLEFKGNRKMFSTISNAKEWAMKNLHNIEK